MNLSIGEQTKLLRFFWKCHPTTRVITMYPLLKKEVRDLAMGLKKITPRRCHVKNIG